MSITAAPPNPCLLAVLLVAQTRTGSGAQIVFHYPPDPLIQGFSDAHGDGGEKLSSSSDSSTDSSSDDDDVEVFIRRMKGKFANEPESRAQGSDEDESYVSKVDPQRRSMNWKPSWEPLFGFGEDALVSLLAPGRAWHKRKFELAINDFVFLGRPVCARENGLWHGRRRKRNQAHDEDDSDVPSDVQASESELGTTEQRANKSFDHNNPNKSQLTMFHVVFVMETPPLEHTLRVKEMYDNVVKKFSKILKWEQSHHDYVSQQTEILASVKSAHLSNRSTTPAMYTDALKRSSLAAAIAGVYTNISSSRIAAVKLSLGVSVSLQIPPVTSTSYLPSLTDPPIQPGLWLTTANDSPSASSDLETASATSAINLAKNFTILLKAGAQNILKQIYSAGGTLVGPLTTFIEQSIPTKSFYKISVASKISLSDIQLLARHLIYWRRAMAIPPLHQRDTYIVSPNADMSKLVEASKAFESNFPMLPSLPKLLNLLSGTPLPYGTLIPSRDHKEEYYRVLAWLMRGGWITQLRTFAYVRVDPDIKKAVREKERQENMHRARSQVESNGLDNNENGENDEESDEGRAGPAKRPSMASRPSSDGAATTVTNSTTSQSIQTPIRKDNPSHASLIHSPPRASPEESRWLGEVAGDLENDRKLTKLPPLEREEVRKHWQLFLKYFNGTEPLEAIPVREGLKRKLVWDLLGRMGLRFDGGVQDEQATDEERADRGRLVVLRHW